jgi:hypothetical protein
MNDFTTEVLEDYLKQTGWYKDRKSDKLAIWSINEKGIKAVLMLPLDKTYIDF